MMNSRVLIIAGLVLAGLCLVRVLSVAAAERDVEVYSATEARADDDSRSSDTDDDSKPEIRISRPDEADARVADDRGYDLVPGAEKYMERQANENALIVPRKIGRKIASEPAQAPAPALEPSPIEVRPESGLAPEAAAPSRAALSAREPSPEVMEPRPFTSSDSQSRRSELRGETIAAAYPARHEALGIHSEPGPDTRIDPPVPTGSGTARAGTQEVSVIVSDYGYFPNRIFVTQNVPVKIYLTTPSKATMCFMIDNWGVKKGVSPGRVEEIAFVPDTPGNYRFYCPVKSIEGTLTVREAPTALPSARGIASEPEKPTAGIGNEPKRAAELRALIED